MRSLQAGESLRFLPLFLLENDLKEQKKFVTFDEQVDLIINHKHITVVDKENAKDILSRIGYFPLMEGYKHLFRKQNSNIYKTESTFDEIVNLYYFDEKLRELFLRYLLRIERHLRTLISYYFVECYGISQDEYLNVNNYNKARKYKNVINKLVVILEKTTNTTDYNYINYYRETYGNLPLWVTTNVLTFGSLSKMFTVLPQSIKSRICKHFNNINQNKMDSFLSVLTKYRNVCAHGECLFSYKTVDSISDTSLHEKLKLPKKGNQYIKGKQDLFAVVIVFRYLLPNSDFLTFKRKLIMEIENVVQLNQHVSREELLDLMGFSNNWIRISRYQL